MDNFRPRANRREKRTHYEYHPSPTGEMVKLSIGHREGGMNHFSGRTELRGIELVFTHIERTTEDGVAFERSAPRDSGNGRLLLLETTRYNPKKVEAVARVFDEQAPELSRLLREDPAGGHRLMRELADRAAAV